MKKFEVVFAIELSDRETMEDITEDAEWHGEEVVELWDRVEFEGVQRTVEKDCEAEVALIFSVKDGDCSHMALLVNAMMQSRLAEDGYTVQEIITR